jgi:hypothetical protein
LNSISIGAEEKEYDLLEAGTDSETKQSFLGLSRKEFHRSGQSTCLAKRYWGGHATEKALKRLAKNLDDQGTRERDLKANLMRLWNIVDLQQQPQRRRWRVMESPLK